MTTPNAKQNQMFMIEINYVRSYFIYLIAFITSMGTLASSQALDPNSSNESFYHTYYTSKDMFLCYYFCMRHMLDGILCTTSGYLFSPNWSMVLALQYLPIYWHMCYAMIHRNHCMSSITPECH